MAGGIEALGRTLALAALVVALASGLLPSGAAARRLLVLPAAGTAAATADAADAHAGLQTISSPREPLTFGSFTSPRLYAPDDLAAREDELYETAGGGSAASGAFLPLSTAGRLEVLSTAHHSTAPAAGSVAAAGGGWSWRGEWAVVCESRPQGLPARAALLACQAFGFSHRVQASWEYDMAPVPAGQAYMENLECGDEAAEWSHCSFGYAGTWAEAGGPCGERASGAPVRLLCAEPLEELVEEGAAEVMYMAGAAMGEVGEGEVGEGEGEVEGWVADAADGSAVVFAWPQ